MAHFVDIEMSEEALQESEEIIEAVEAMVEIAAVSVKSQIEEDINSVLHDGYLLLVTWFPLFVDYQHDPWLMWEHLERFGIFAALFLVGFWVLEVFPMQRNKLRGMLNTSNQHSLRENTIWRTLKRRCHSDSSRHDTSQGRNTSLASSWNNNDHGSESEEGHYDSQSGILMEDAADTDEERYAQMWEKLHVESRYAALLIPPTCRLVADFPRRLSSTMARSTSTGSKKQRQTHQQPQPPAAVDLPVEDEMDNNSLDFSADKTRDLRFAVDDPAQRLNTYISHFFYFIRSIFTFDYGSAIHTLWLGIQSVFEQRRTNRVRSFADESERPFSAGTTKTSPHRVRPKTQIIETSTNGTAGGGLRDEQQEAENNATESKENVAMDETNSMDKPEVPMSGAKSSSEKATDSTNILTPRKMALSPNDGHAQILTSVSSDAATVYFDLSAAPSEKAITSQISNSTPLGRGLPAPSTPKLTANHANDGCENDTAGAPPANPLHAIREAPPEIKLTGSSSPSKISLNYFETAHCAESLKQMSLEVPVPDRNGYILGDEYLPDSQSSTPLLVFVNSRSGPQQGHLLITQFRRLLNPIQVWDLADGGPERILESFCVFTRLRLLVCGGDGTVSWIISALDSLNLDRKWPPIAILPLGTGNDLARVHGWGAGYNNESLISILEQVAESYISVLDRWQLKVEDSHGRTKTKPFLNYLGIGCDADLTLQVHYLRERQPDWFFSRLFNKVIYGFFGAENTITSYSILLRKAITLYADGVQIPLPSDTRGLIILNIDSYAGGIPIWSHGERDESLGETTLSEDEPYGGAKSSLRRSQSTSVLRSLEGRSRVTRLAAQNRVDSSDNLGRIAQTEERERFHRVTACNQPASCQDGLLEVVSVRSTFHLGQIKVGLAYSTRLCQCRELKVVLRKKIAIQVDGEPWQQEKAVLHVGRSHATMSPSSSPSDKHDPSTVLMLHRSDQTGGVVETEMSQLLDWAEDRKLIDSRVHSILMTEFSRRLESKKHQRKQARTSHLLHNLKRAIGSTGAISNLSGTVVGASPLSRQETNHTSSVNDLGAYSANETWPRRQLAAEKKPYPSLPFRPGDSGNPSTVGIAF